MTGQNVGIYPQEFGGYMCCSSAVVGPLCHEQFFCEWCQFDIDWKATSFATAPYI
jgi:hypothetical protein